MGASTNIAWADATFNPWIGCTKVSAGCKHCYAEALATRTKFAQWGDQAERRVTSASNWLEPLAWNRKAPTYEGKAGRGRLLVFVASMADVFEDRRDLDEPRAWLFELIERTPALTWLLLTKRPENIRKLAPKSWRRAWPANAWAGTTAEDQETLVVRSLQLMSVPCDVRFLSCEPLIECVDLDFPWCDYCDTRPTAEGECGEPWCAECDQECVCGVLDPCADHVQRGINWVIVGGESGPGARPFDLSWARGVVAKCAEDGVPCFVKQLGSNPVGDRAIKLRSRAGEDPSEWPEELRVRQWPTGRNDDD